MRGAVLAQRPLSLAELASVTEIGEQEFLANEDMTDFASDIVRSCGSLMDIRDGICHFVHQLTKDFFLDSEAGKDIFEKGLPASHGSILCRSIEAMSGALTKDDICSLEYPWSPLPNSQKILESPLWPFRYSCSFWVSELIGSVR